MTDEKTKEGLRLKGEVDVIQMDGSLLINAGTSRCTKISGEYAPLAQRMLEMLKNGAQVQEIYEAFEEDLDEMDVDEILETLDQYQLIEKTTTDYGLSKEELTQYRQQINHLVARFPMDAAENYIRQLKNLDIFVYGAEILASRIIQSLTLAGVGALNVFTNLNEVVADEVFNTTFFRQEDIGKNKQEVIVNRARELNPHVKLNVFYEEEDQEVLKKADLVILAFDIPNYAAYEEINRFLVKHKKMSLLCGFVQDDFFYGPTMVPGETACYACFEKRCRGNKSFFNEYIGYMEFLKQKQRVGNAMAVRLDMITSFVVNEVLFLVPYLEKNISQIMSRRIDIMTMEESVYLNNIFRYGRPTTWNNQVTIEFYPQFRLVNNPVLRLPRCEVCGSTADKKPMLTPWSLPLE
jgi:molybdopterin/thiamine biosynthesis adenylyltransferase